MSPKQIALITRNQFGYQTDYFNYLKHLSQSYGTQNVKMYCLHSGLVNVSSDGLNVSYVGKLRESRIFRLFKLLWVGFAELKLGKIVMVKYLPGVSVLRFSKFRKNLVIDLRTLSVSPNPSRRWLEDLLCRFEIKGHANVTAISNVVGKKIGLKKFQLLPLGADLPAQRVNPEVIEIGQALRLVYAGTLEGRQLEVLIEALYLASKEIPVELRIIGDGRSKSKLVEGCAKYGVTKLVTFYGHIQHGQEFSRILQSSHVGIVHVPPTSFYEGQPSTKLYEYWAHGLPVLCSNYPAGASEVLTGTGLIYNFDSESLSNRIIDFYEHPEAFSSQAISTFSSERTWSRVIDVYLMPIIQSLHGK